MKKLLRNPQKFCNRIVAHLSRDQKQLAKLLRDNAPITKVESIELAGFDIKERAECDLASVNLTFVPKVDGRVLLAFYPEEANVQLSDFVLTEFRKQVALDDVPQAFTVPEGKLVCAIDLGARLQAAFTGEAGAGSGNLSFFARGGVRAGTKFFKLLDGNLGARDAVVATASGLKTFFQIVSQPPAVGEIVVTEFAGSLSFGAEIGYGFEVSGTKNLDSGLEDVTLDVDYAIKAKGGATVNFRLERDLLVVVRATGADQWVNVSYLKKHGSEAAIALNLRVDAKLSTGMASGGARQEVGALVDALLSTTPLPNLMSQLQDWGTTSELKAKADEVIEEFMDQVSFQLRDVLENPAAQVDQLVQPIRDAAAELVKDIEQIGTEVTRFMETAADRVEALQDIDEAVTLIDGSTSAEDLLVELSGQHGRKVRRGLAIFSTTLDLDLSQVSWLQAGFGRIKDLARRYTAVDEEIRRRFEERYRWLKLQLQVDDAVALLRKVTDTPTLQAFLDKKIIWVEQHLAKRLNTTVEGIAEALEPALGQVRALTSGYDKLVEKAKKALETGLNREASLQASLAWQRVSTHQALVSVDVNLATDAGRDAMRDLLMGRIGDVMLDRLTNADAIRFRRSCFLDQIRSSVSLKLVVNGRQRLSRSSLLTSTRTVLEPTARGEIWVQESAVETSVHRRNRRAILDVHTLFEVSLQELYERLGKRLRGRGPRLRGAGLRYSYTETLQGTVSAAAVRAQLRETASKINFELVPPDDYDELCEGIDEVGRLGDLSKPTIDIDVRISPDALVEIFSDPDTENVRARARDAYSKAVRVAFGELERVVAFYMARKDTGFDGSEVRSAQWGLKVTEQMMAQNITNSYATFSDQLAEIHSRVFLRMAKLGGDRQNEEEPRHARLGREMRTRLGRLGKKMSWINGIQLGDRPRDFTMAIFAHMVEPSDRSGSIAVHYDHPISNERLTLRVDDSLDLTTEVSNGNS